MTGSSSRIGFDSIHHDLNCDPNIVGHIWITCDTTNRLVAVWRVLAATSSGMFRNTFLQLNSLDEMGFVKKNGNNGSWNLKDCRTFNEFCLRMLLKVKALIFLFPNSKFRNIQFPCLQFLYFPDFMEFVSGLVKGFKAMFRIILSSTHCQLSLLKTMVALASLACRKQTQHLTLAAQRKVIGYT